MADAAARVRLKIQFGETSVGPGKIRLLEEVAREGSISGAARASGMTYRRAWHLLNTLQQALDGPVLATETGGRDKGGARLTDLGETLVRLYREAEARTEAGAAPLKDLLRRHGR